MTHTKRSPGIPGRFTWEPWLEFAQETGGSGFERIIPAGPLFSDARLMLDAACDGHGIALARSPLAAADLRSGRLLRVLDIAVDSPQAYRAYMRRRSGLRPSMQQFVEWLQVTCKRFEF